MKNWKSVLPSVLIFAWSLAWILSQHFSYLPASYDSAYYLVIAKGFASGHYYKDFSTPDPSVGTLLGPSLYPMLLSLYWRFLDPGLLALQMITSAAMALSPVMAFFWLRLWLAPALAFLISLAFGSSYMFIVLGNSFMTEVVFTPLLYAGMWLSHRSLQATVTQVSPQGGAEMLGEGKGMAGGVYGRDAIKPWFAMLLWVMIARTRVVGWVFLALFSGMAAKAGRWKLLIAGIGLAGAWVALEQHLAAGVKVSKYTDGEFSKTYPIMVDLIKGLRIWGKEAWHSIHGFVTSIDAHILFPYLYDLSDMSLAKRIVCLSVFLWSVWGAWLAWRRWEALRPWLLAAFVASLPTILIFTTNDSFRYHVPFFPFIALVFVTPFIHLGDGSNSLWKKHLPLAACILMAASQSLHAIDHDFESEFMTLPREFSVINDFILAAPKHPDICLSPNNYYTYLKTGLPSLHLQGRHGLAYVRKLARGKEVWAICGPTNEFFCEDWERKGVVFGNPPLKKAGDWRLHRVEAWPDNPPPE